MNKDAYAKYNILPNLSYNILEYLIQEPRANMIWKLLKYNDTDDEQSGDMGKKFSGTLGIKIGTVNSVLLTDAMLRDNPTISERTDFSVTNIDNTTGTLYKTNKTEDGRI